MSELPVDADTTAPKQQIGRPFVAGQSGNPKGRPKGSRNKLAEDFVGDALNAWKEHGPAALKTMATEEPSKFCQMVAGILPKEIKVETAPEQEMTDDELVTYLDRLKSLVRTAALEGAREGARAPDQAEPAQDLRPVH